MKNVLFLLGFIFMFSACSKDPVVPTPPILDENNLPTEFSALFNIFDGQGIGAATNLNDDIMLFVSSDGMQYAWFEDNEIKRTGRIDEEDGLFDGIAFSAVGGIIDYEEERLVMFNKVGGTYQWVDINPDMVAGNSASNSLLGFSSFTYQLWEWGEDNTCPFDEITAMFGFSKEAEGCMMTQDDDLYMWMVNDDGDELVRYIKDGGIFEEAVEIDQWRSNSVCGGSPAIFPLSGIGAACVYDPDGGIYQEIFFSPDGLKMTILTPSQGKYSEVYDLK